MKNTKYLILTLGLLALLLRPSPAFADSVMYEAHTPATGNYTAFCDGSYHGLRYCEITDSFSLDSAKLINAITLFDIGCNSRDEVEMFLSYDLVQVTNHAVVATTIHSRHKVCTPDYPTERNVPTTLEINPTVLAPHQSYYLILRASNNERARAYWGVDSTNHASFQLHGLPAPKEPVILVPGIMGSSLKRVSGGGEIWPNVNEMVLSGSDNYLDELKLDANGNQVAGKEAEPGAMLERASFSVFGQNLITQTLYGDLVKQFTDRGYVLGTDLFELAYDWRSDLRTQVARLESAVMAARAASSDSKVNIVAHSMGGLLVKQYLAVPENASLVDKVVLVGTPQIGAPAMFKVLNYGDNLGFQFPVIQKDILNPAEVKAIVQNMPGAYELLPSRRYVTLAGGYIKDFRNNSSKTLSYDETATLMTASSSDSRNPTLIAAGQTFHDALDQQPIVGPKVYNLTACGNSATIGEIRLYDNGKIDIAGTDGDGTVPLASAMHMADGYTNYFVSSPGTGIDHGRLVKDDRITTLIERLAEGVDTPLAEGIKTSSDACMASQSIPTMLRFSTHSPVALHVYDSAGHHTGPSADGNIELGIQDSNYTTLGENSFVFVPAGVAYRVVVDGLAQGQFDLKTETLDGLDIVASVNYIGVPLAGASTVAEATFSSADPDPVLSLDSNGDGTADANIPPTAQLFGVTAADSEPPRINVSGVPTGTVVAGTSFAITFSASDLLSGVATTSATLDGVPFASGATLTSSLAGQREIIVQAIDNAGNPKVFTAEFTQTAAPTPPPQQPASGGSGTQGSGGQGSSSQGSSNRQSGSHASKVSRTTSSVLGVATTTPIATTSINRSPALASSCLTPPTATLGRGRSNNRDQVVLLQKLLNRELGISIPLTGFFGPITELAVKIFQLKNYADVLAPAGLTAPTGFVGKYTLAKMGALACT